MRLSFNPCRTLAMAAAFALVLTSIPQRDLHAAEEPDFQRAKDWWPPLRNVWTPVGVKNHPFRFTVLYNGTIVADTHPLREMSGRPIKPYLMPFAGKGVQLSLTPSFDGSLPPAVMHSYQLSSRPDGGVGLQDWDNDHAAPILRTRWPMEHRTGSTGVVLSEEVFAHTPGGEPVRTGKEPLYLWMRLRVAYLDPLNHAASATMLIHIGNPDMMQRSMWHEENLTVHPDRAIYPRQLTRDAYQNGQLSCCRLVEPDGSVRLVAMMASGSAMLEERAPGSRDYFLRVDMPATEGTHVDLLIPMIPGGPKEVRREADLGYEGALVQSDKYWSERPSTAAVVDTPEPQVNNAVRRMVEQAQVISETNPENGEKSLLTGSWNYDTLWPTPTCMAAHMLLDQLGYHEFVAENLEIFRTYQGTVEPPGPAFSRHPGYFGAPRQLSSIDWITDHGSILQSVATHALVTGDERFIQQWTDSIVQACEFLRESRSNNKHDGVPGLLPPAVASDTGVSFQAAWNIAWNYKGLDSAVRLLRRMGHPLADEYEKERQEFKRTFVEAYRAHAETTPTWTDSAGVVRHVSPSTLSGADDVSHIFFLDTGPMICTYADLLPGDDKLMLNAMEFYRHGPHSELYDPRGNMHQRPVLTHEISSCEPCYSFNILCSWHSGDRSRFMEGLYGLLAGGISQQTFSGCEHRHGIWSLPAPGALMFYCMKLAVIDDQLNHDELHLLRLVPLAWVKSDYQTRFERMPTEFGPVDLRFKLSPDGSRLHVDFAGHWRTKPARVILHAPPVPGLTTLVINGVERPTEAQIAIDP